MNPLKFPIFLHKFGLKLHQIFTQVLKVLKVDKEVWASFAVSGPGRLASIDGTKNSELYEQILMGHDKGAVVGWRLGNKPCDRKVTGLIPMSRRM